MKEFLKPLGVHIRSLGFKGSGQNFKKVEDEYIFVINIQFSRTGDDFFINLGAQPTFIPAECNADLASLKEYECVMRTRVGKQWSCGLDHGWLGLVIKELEFRQGEFFGLVKTLRSSIATDSPEELIRKFNAGTTSARAALHLARAASSTGHVQTADALVECGLALAGERATSLIHDLKLVRQSIHSRAT